MCHTVALPFTLKSTLRQEKNDENSNILPCKNITYKNSSKKRNQNPSRYYNSYNKSQVSTQAQNIIFQKSSCKTRPIITWGPKSLKLLYSIMNLNTTISLPGKAKPTKQMKLKSRTMLDSAGQQ